MKKVLFFVALTMIGFNLKSQWLTNGTSLYYLNGNVGIGVDSPSEKLVINGKLKVGSRLAFTPSYFGYNSSYKSLILGSTGTSYSTNAVTISFGYDPSTNTNSAFTGNGDEILFRNQAIFIQPNSTNNGYLNTLTLKNGFVGIGTKNPQSLLAVSGKVTAKEVEVTLTGWSDFVFDKNYSLLSLDDLEKYINENRHLPDVPSEEEVLENGLNLGDNNAVLLQKIEELTLYLIELNKENKELKKRIENLESNNVQQ